MVSLRPAGQHRRLLRAFGALGAEAFGLPGLRLVAREDTPARAALDTALQATFAIFTSPAAVRFCMRLRTDVVDSRDLFSRLRTFALGAATAQALRRAGFVHVDLPARADSESLLALPELRDLHGKAVGLVTAPGGRGLIPAALRERGAALAIAQVYTRQPARLDARHVQRLLGARGKGAVCVTSAEALTNVLAALPAPARVRLLDAVALASSARLCQIARQAGFAGVIEAASPAPRDLLAALQAHAQEG